MGHPRALWLSRTLVCREYIDPITQYAPPWCNSSQEITSVALSPPSDPTFRSDGWAPTFAANSDEVRVEDHAGSRVIGAPNPFLLLCLHHLSRSATCSSSIVCGSTSLTNLRKSCHLAGFPGSKTNFTPVYTPLGPMNDLALAAHRVGMMSRLHLSHQLRPTCLASLELVSTSVQHPLVSPQAS